ncbi:MAG: amino acid adenylation domain-containing protein, partial [bacterium]|nr:amino acid adenylation domain-containing protein [bacterium]
RLYIIHQMDEESTAYNMPQFIPFDRVPPVEKLEEAFAKLIHRHESLRTSFHMIHSLPVQRVHDHVEFEIEFFGRGAPLWSPLHGNHSGSASSFVRPFDLSRAPLLRVGLTETSEGKHVLMVDMHHIISDGISMEVLEMDFIALVERKSLPRLRLHYKDFAQWQTRESEMENIKDQETYWLREFEGEIPVLQLPVDYPRPAVQSFQAGNLDFRLSVEESRGLRTVALETGSTLFMVLLSLTTLLLSKLSGQEDIVIGTPIAGRRHADLEKIIGMFVNTLSLRNYPRGHGNFIDFLGDVKTNALNAFENQEYQFEDLVERLSVERDAGRNPVFDVMFLLNNINTGESTGDAAASVKEREPRPESPSDRYEDRVAKFDLTIAAVETGERLLFGFQYCTELFKRETVQRFIGYFKQLLSSVVQAPGHKLSDIEIISPVEKEQLLFGFNNTRRDYPGHKPIHHLFEEQVSRGPDRTALVFSYDHRALSYREMSQRSGHFARRLEENGVTDGAVVGIISTPSPELITGILGILKAGGAYLPIDPEYPQARVEFMLRDSAAKVIVDNGLTVKRLDDSNEPTDKPTNKRTGQSTNLAYVLYTSGSTGQPKGVMVEHRNVVRLVKNTDYIRFDTNDRILQTGPLTFDASTFEVWGALLNGLTLCLTAKQEILDAGTLKRIVRAVDIRTMWLTAPLFNQLVQADIDIFKGLRNLLVGGDVLSPLHINRVIERFPRLRLINGYGPTENTTFSTTYQVAKPFAQSIPIGKPIANSVVYILDRYGHPQPVAVPGEICVGGDGVSRGYLNNPELTNEKFDHDFKDFRDDHDLKKGKKETPAQSKKAVKSAKSAVKIYKTGDLGRWMEDGNIEFLGRIDHQVKIRGFRIEPGEIENRLLRQDNIKDAVVSVRSDQQKAKYLCAYVVFVNPSQSLDLREYLSGDLPDYMVPSYFVELGEIPLTANGKVDRRALPSPGLQAGADYIAPASAIEIQLAQLWADVLEIEPSVIGIDNNFFELGGHSLKATILVSNIHKASNVKVPLTEVFRTPTIRELAQYIHAAARERYAAVEPIENRQYYALSSAQKRQYILYQMNPQSTAYNMPQFIPFGSIPYVELFREAFINLIDRHESLRTSFHMVHNQPVQRVHDHVEFSLEFRTENSPDNGIQSFVRPFDLSKVPLMRVGLVKRGEGKHLLMVDMHHIISDGVSMNVLRKDFIALYEDQVLPPLRIHYKDFAQWQNSLFEKENIANQETFWLDQFSVQGEIPVLQLPVDYPRPAVQSFDGTNFDSRLTPGDSRGIRTLALETGSTLFMTLLSFTTILLSKLSGQEDIVVGIPIAGRRHADIEKIIGMFVNTLPMRNYPGGEKTAREFLKEVKERTLRAFENQEYQFEDLVEKLPVERNTGRNPLFDVMFLLNNTAPGAAGEESPPPTAEEKEPLPESTVKSNIDRVAKFDLTLAAVETGESLGVGFQYSTRLFKPGTIQRFMGYFKRLVSSIVQTPGMKLSQLEIISPEEKQRLLIDFNDSQRDYPKEKNIHQLFEEQVERTPDRIAVVSDAPITYRELNRRSNGLAHLLNKNGVGSRTNPIVAIMTERSLEMVIGIYGILKAGGAYLPIAPDYPQERIQYMLKDSGAKVIVANGLTVNGSGGLKVINPGDARQLPNQHTIKPTNQQSNLAYIIYTSGSTGHPKGVMVEQRSLVNLAFDLQQRYPFGEEDTYLLKTNYVFDVSLSELMGWFLGGGRLGVLEKEGEKDPLAIVDSIEKFKVTHINFVPAMFNAFIRHLNPQNIHRLACLKYIFLAGEALPSELVVKFKQFRTGILLENLYGPTEATVYASLYSLEDWKESPVVPIGKPLGNARLYILDSYSHLQAVGVPGELCISGDGVARGYINNPQLTNETFGQKEFEPSTSLYHTGDLARWMPDGNIEFLGRVDHQVKIRGYRIELGEIENQLLRYPGIKEAIVSTHSRSDGDQYICAFVVPMDAGIVTDREKNNSEWREFLLRSLPDYMIPAYFIVIEQVPLTPSGKIDRKSLPLPEIIADDDYSAPRNETETELVAIWSEVLGIEKSRIGIDSNFFQLGGHSLKATIMVSMVRSRLEVSISLVEVFNTSTIRQLAGNIKRTPAEKHAHSFQDDRLVLLREHSDNRRHLFFIHDGSGEVEGYLEFCRQLSIGFNCWGIRMASPENIGPQNVTIEDLASQYIQTLKKVQPHGPYFISGWSIGGTIAFEMVRQLEYDHREHAILSLIDATPPPPEGNRPHVRPGGTFTPQSERVWLQNHLQDEEFNRKLENETNINRIWSHLVDYLEKTNTPIRSLESFIPEGFAPILPRAAYSGVRDFVYYVNIARTLISSRELYTTGDKLKTAAIIFGAGQSGIDQGQWSRYFREPLEFNTIDGDHFSIFTKPVVIEFAKTFEEIIDKHRESST